MLFQARQTGRRLAQVMLIGDTIKIGRKAAVLGMEDPKLYLDMLNKHCKIKAVATPRYRDLSLTEKKLIGFTFELETPKFFCHGCGLCCKNVRYALQNKNKRPEPIKKLLEEFPYTYREDGACEKLLEDNTCGVYDNRPTVCNVEESKFAFGPELTDEQYYARQENSCKELMRHHGYSEKEIKKVYKSKL